MMKLPFILMFLAATGICQTHNETEAESRNDEQGFYPSTASGSLCQTCSCPPLTPTCDPGVSLVLDGCGCCKVCARQRAEACDERAVCDKHRGLYCDMATGTCKATPGRDCMIGGKWYNNGDVFQPSCRVKCWCIDGSMGCLPQCKPPPRTSAVGCSYPRLVYTKEHCCGEWKCTTDDRRPKLQVKGQQSSVLERKGDCLVQTTHWSECSKTCGFGVSDRVSNNNELCKLKKETRLCMIRPCNMQKMRKSKKRSCRKTMFKRGRIQFSLNGCVSSVSYRPKYCGTCDQPGRCCKPIADKTINVTFRCDVPSKKRRSSSPSRGSNSTSASLPSSFERKMMWLTKCSCDEVCPHENDIFAFTYHGFGRDHKK